MRADARKRSIPAPGRDGVVDALVIDLGGLEAGADTVSTSFGYALDSGSSESTPLVPDAGRTIVGVAEASRLRDLSLCSG